jgi:3-polyprenyl-4-hydroxybenzoate decarboxylase
MQNFKVSKERPAMVSAASNDLLLRAPAAGIAERGGELIIAGADRSIRKLSGSSAELASAVLSFLVTPHSRAQLTAHLEELSGKPIEHPEVVADLLALLLSAGVLQDAAAPRGEQRSDRATAPRTRVVLGLTGAIGVAHAPAMVAALLERGCDLEIAATEAALTLVSRMALEALTHRRVHGSLRGHDVAIPVPHIHLAAWAEVVLVCPATATTLARIAHGDSSDLVAALVIATRGPVLVVPSMNPTMLGAPAVRRNLETLRQDGIWVVDAAMGQEVAAAPSERQAIWGAAPAPATVLSILDALLALQRERPTSGVLRHGP